jgi:hypothetical protein
LAPLVLAARRAAALREVDDRLRAACRACRDNAADDAELRGSCFSAARTARERELDVRLFFWLRP